MSANQQSQLPLPSHDYAQRFGSKRQTFAMLMQLIIMLTPINTFFTVSHQIWQEWVFALGVAAGCMLLSLFVKVISR